MIKVTKNQIKIIFVGLTFILSIVLALWVYTSVYKKPEAHPINDFRLIVHPIYQEIRELPIEGGIQVFSDLNAHKDYLNLTIVDLAGHVIGSSQIAFIDQQKLFLDELFYMDSSYERDERFYKLSLPIYKEATVNGFAIFEIEIEYLDSLQKDMNNSGIKLIRRLVHIFIPFLLGLMIILLWYLLYGYRDPLLDELKEKMTNISKGILEPIHLKTHSEIRDLVVVYNSVIEELSYIMAQQSRYEQKRKDFLTKVSHELKTPIATINAYVEGLMSPLGDSQETRERYHQIIYDKMQHLLYQIDALFKYAQEESDRFKYHFEEVYADIAFGQIFRTFEDNHKLNTCIDNKLPKCIVSIDKIRIEQVLMNLVNNASKHSQPSDCISLRGYRQDREIIIEVEDQGQGITPKDMPYIFDTYYQGEQSDKKDYEGIGLGLSICKDIITQHKGRIKVKSVVGEGTLFTISIPIV